MEYFDQRLPSWKVLNYQASIMRTMHKGYLASGNTLTSSEPQNNRGPMLTRQHRINNQRKTAIDTAKSNLSPGEMRQEFTQELRFRIRKSQ